MVAWFGSGYRDSLNSVNRVKQSRELLLSHHYTPGRGLPNRWQRIHLDFAGPFQGAMFLVCVDAYSKWPEVEIMSSTTVSKMLSVLRGLFAAHPGIPEQIVTDNGPQFIAEDVTFTKRNGIKHIKTAPYHPASNGLCL